MVAGGKAMANRVLPGTGRVTYHAERVAARDAHSVIEVRMGKEVHRSHAVDVDGRAVALEYTQRLAHSGKAELRIPTAPDPDVYVSSSRTVPAAAARKMIDAMLRAETFAREGVKGDLGPYGAFKEHCATYVSSIAAEGGVVTLGRLGTHVSFAVFTAGRQVAVLMGATAGHRTLPGPMRHRRRRAEGVLTARGWHYTPPFMIARPQSKQGRRGLRERGVRLRLRLPPTRSPASTRRCASGSSAPSPRPPPRRRSAGRPSRAASRTLLLAPTGSGKTLAAFLSCLDRLMFAPEPAERGAAAACSTSRRSRRWPSTSSATCARRSSASPQVAARGGDAATTLPAVAVRTGDTPPRERARFSRAPADILITTPESLYLLLTSHARERAARASRR